VYLGKPLALLFFGQLQDAQAMRAHVLVQVLG
jgi:hypothetical protein